ncbi:MULTISPECIES: heme exporter protein CcmD [Providencia]|uniref:heme exporter protein CcmD n=1 Tax=Providencia TaxID=586 RepID=UPI00197D3689|nr:MULTISPECIES: heme exporter protein CcmD [Providencia]HEC8327495.1 heme exporter protein CcmD [Providencia rettgeri]MBN4864023.1 heme exporter protein CcmD [Providencia stuartii]MBN4873345.1 heme exporter protein CcmD [Providencia stuartii]MBN4877534.1 heme exporter protein CcmD [Providencia stuartii]MBN4882546.1 heme exporter protein CcmD [Providencia stuartii]
MTSAFASWSDFFAMGGYGFYVWLAVALTLIPILLLCVHTVIQRKMIINAIIQQQAREQRQKTARARREEM